MSELSGFAPEAGTQVFGAELAMIQAAADEHEGDLEEMVTDLAVRALEFGPAHPYFGRCLRLEAEDPFMMEHMMPDGRVEQVELEAGEYELNFTGFGMTFERDADNTELFPILTLLMQVEGMDDCIATIEPETIADIRLADVSNPFDYDINLLDQAHDNFDKLEVLYDHADYDTYMDHFVDEDLHRLTPMHGAEVEVLFVEATEILVSSQQEVPTWVDNELFEGDMQTDENFGPELDEDGEARLYRGVIVGEFIRYSLEDDDEDGSPLLVAYLRLSPDCPILADEPWLRYVGIPVEFVSWGRVRHSPRFN